MVSAMWALEDRPFRRSGSKAGEVGVDGDAASMPAASAASARLVPGWCQSGGICAGGGDDAAPTPAACAAGGSDRLQFDRACHSTALSNRHSVPTSCTPCQPPNSASRLHKRSTRFEAWQHCIVTTWRLYNLTRNGGSLINRACSAQTQTRVMIQNLPLVFTLEFPFGPSDTYACTQLKNGAQSA